MSSHNVLVLATGDAGAAAQTLLSQLQAHAVAGHWWVSLQGDDRLRVEHALALTHADLCVFVVQNGSADNALSAAKASYQFNALQRGSGHLMASAESDLSPQDLVHTLSTLSRHGREPRCYVLSVPAEGEAADHDAALALLIDLLENPDAGHWDARLA